MTEPISLAQAHEHLRIGLYTGLFTPFAYILGSHVLDRMEKAKTRQIMLSVSEFGHDFLVGQDGSLVAGSVFPGIHQGSGMVFGKSDVSLKYIDALKLLHWYLGLHNDIQEARLNEEGCEESHFSGRPDINPGVHWTERTPIIYRLTSRDRAGAFQLLAQGLNEVSGETNVVISSIGGRGC